MGGGGGSSTSKNSQTQTQTQTDSRQAVQGGTAIGAGGTNSSIDSHAITDSGNSSTSTSTVVNWTGTDTGSLHLADLATQLAHASGEQNLQALSGLEDLAAVQGQNQLQFATHMLDTTGDLIGKFATGISAQANAATLQTAQATAQQASNQQLTKYLLIGGGVIALAIIMKKG